MAGQPYLEVLSASRRRKTPKLGIFCDNLRVLCGSWLSSVIRFLEALEDFNDLLLSGR